MVSFELDHPLEFTAYRSAVPNSCLVYYSHLGITDRPRIRDLDDVETSASSQFMNEAVWAGEVRKRCYHHKCLGVHCWYLFPAHVFADVRMAREVAE